VVLANVRHRFWQTNFNQVCAKHVDFLICDAALSPIMVVELDDSSHLLPDRIARDRVVNRILKSASLPILRVPVRRAYDADELENQLLAKIGRRG
jgi:very-short-patch-repair endonuclease